MPDRTCQGCKRQVEWGCTAKRVFDANGDPVLDEIGEQVWSNPAHLPTTIMKEEVWCCPRQPLKENPLAMGRLFTFYGMFKRGFLPNDGGVLDQSNPLLETFRIMDDVNEECQRALDEEERRKAQRNESLTRMRQQRGR